MSRLSQFGKKSQASQQATADNRYALYIRASTPEQVNSLDVQKQAAARFAERFDLIIDETFIGAGVSAVEMDLRDRPEAVAMFRHMRHRGIRNILVLRVDRAFRSSRDFALTLAWAEEQGFCFRFIEPDIDMASPTGKLIVLLQVGIAQMECELRSARVEGALDSLRQRRLSRNGNQAPYGWSARPCAERTRKGGQQYEHLPVPAEQAVLREMQRLYALHSGAHGTLSHIARSLNALAIPTKMAGQTFMKNGVACIADGQWKAATVKSVLAHAVLATDAELIDGLPSLAQAIATLSTGAAAAPNLESQISDLKSQTLSPDDLLPSF